MCYLNFFDADTIKPEILSSDINAYLLLSNLQIKDII